MDKKYINLVLYYDRSFATNKNGTCEVQYRYISDKHKRENLIDYASNKSRRVAISVLGAEMFGLAQAFDSAIPNRNPT